MPGPKRDLPPASNVERISAFIKRWNLRRHFEAWYPAVSGFAVGIIFLRVSVSQTQADKINSQVLPLAVSVAAILAGFQGAMHAIFLAVVRSKVLRFLRDKNAYKSLMLYIRSGVVSLVMFVAAAMAFITWSAIDMLPGWSHVMYATLAGLFAYSLLSSSRIMLLLLRLLQHADDQ